MHIPDTSAALNLFCQAANKHAAHTQIIDYQGSKKVHKQLITALQWLETHQQSQMLIPLLASPQAGECMWAAAYLLLHQHAVAEVTLQSLASQPGIIGFNANLTLCEWWAGQLASLW